MHDFTNIHTHVQDGCTALWLACENQHEAAALELVEPTKQAGALNKQVGAWKGGEDKGWTRGEGRGGGRRALTCAGACLSTV